MLIHSLVIYAWPISLIRDVEHAVKRFMRSGEAYKSKLIAVMWKTCAIPKREVVLV